MPRAKDSRSLCEPQRACAAPGVGARPASPFLALPVRPVSGPEVKGLLDVSSEAPPEPPMPLPARVGWPKTWRREQGRPQAHGSLPRQHSFTEHLSMPVWLPCQGGVGHQEDTRVPLRVTARTICVPLQGHCGQVQGSQSLEGGQVRPLFLQSLVPRNSPGLWQPASLPLLN